MIVILLFVVLAIGDLTVIHKERGKRLWAKITGQTVVDDGLAKPILIARPSVLKMRIDRLGLRIDPEKDVDVVNPENDPRYREYWQLYHAKMERKGVVRHRSEGRQYVYRPTVSERDVTRSMVADLADRLFGGDPTALVSHLLREHGVDQGEIAVFALDHQMLTDEHELAESVAAAFP